MRIRNVSFSEKAYKLFLYLYPAPHRRHYGKLMAQLFLDMYNEAKDKASKKEIVLLWVRLIPDVITNVIVEHIDHRKGEYIMGNSSFRPFKLGSFVIWVVGSSIIIPICLYAAFISEWMFVPLSVLGILGLQWYILRRHIPKASRWIWGNISALFLGGVFIVIGAQFLTNIPAPDWLLQATAFIFYGTFLGLIQWFILRAYFSNVVFWITLNIVALLLVQFAVGESFSNNVDLALLGGIPALFTGLALVWASIFKQVSTQG